ncbi:hypothetical protein BGZ65_011738, partial [Modicella reniformis]
MPDHKTYIPQRQPVLTAPPVSTVQPSRPDKPSIQTLPTKVINMEPKVILKETTTPIATVMGPSTKATSVERPIGVSTVPTIIASDSNHLLTSPTSTPGAFPEPVAKPLERVTEETAPSKSNVDSKISPDGVENAEGAFAEDMRSVSTKVGSTDGGSTRGERTGSKTDYLREHEHNQAPISLDDGTGVASLDRYHREEFLDRYRYPDEEAGAHFRGNDPRRDAERDELGVPILDDLYDDPYSPTSGDQFSFYDDADDGLRMEDPRRFYDDDESQHSGSIPIRRDRGEYFASRARYEGRDYDRSYQHYSSSMPTRHQQHTYLSERELDQAEWTAAELAASENADLSSYAREQYPTAREYPPRPTLEDRERELELINQKITASSYLNSGPGSVPGAGVGAG